MDANWPRTGAGSISSGYIASGTATTLLWGTKGFTAIAGFLTVNKVSQRTLVAFEEGQPNGDGLTAGYVQGIDGAEWDIDVRDDTAQVTSALVVGATILVRDGAGLISGRNGSASTVGYTGIITRHDWESAPKTAAGRQLTVKNFRLIHPNAS